jgi:hypothetical protein
MEAGIRQPKLTEVFEEWKSRGGAEFTLPRLKNWRRTAQLLARSSAPVALRHYCGVDKKFRSLEEDVERDVIEYEQQIDAQIHDRRFR